MKVDPLKIIALLFLSAIVALISLAIWALIDEVKVQRPAQYQAWVKQTGNPKSLNYEEWSLLMNASRKSPDTQFIFIGQ